MLLRRSMLGGAVSLLLLVAACPAAAGVQTRWRPPRHLTWYWQLTGTVSPTHLAAAYDVDAFQTPASFVRRLHAEHRHVICYVDAGTWENWRPDARRFHGSILGRGDGWPGERWLDIRRLSVLGPLMSARMRICRRKGFDAVEADNIDGYTNRTGFPLTARDQLRYDRWLARRAHAMGLAIFQKNDPSQARALEPYFDGALDEQCNQYDECSALRPYLAAGKPVLNAEYRLPRRRFCAADRRAGIMGAVYSIKLDGSRYEPCWR